MVMNERELFLAALEIGPADRAAHLDAACGTDLPLRQRLEKLLEAHANAQSFLKRPAHDLGATAGEARDGRRGLMGPGSWIGPYQVVEQIGEGGMGVIYKAR